MTLAERSEIPEDQMFYLDPMEISVKEDLPRVREHMDKIAELAESIRTKGQFNPILINRSNELIMGGRRLAACLVGGLKVKCAYKDAVDPLVMRELELEENLQRENLTPAEEVLAIDEIDRLKREKYGSAVSGRDGGWGEKDTAELIGKTQGTVSQAKELAEFIRIFPDLKQARSKSDIKKAAKGIMKINQRLDAVNEYEMVVNKLDSYPVYVEKADARDYMKTFEDHSVSLLMTDPIYGIDIDENAISVGNQTGGFSSTGFKYDDDHDEAMELYQLLATESFRFCTDNAHAWIFLGPENFWEINKIFQAAGWLVYVKPFIWIKGPTGQNNAPHAWPSSAYEMAMYCRKQDSKLVVEGKVDWMQCPKVLPSERLHNAEKPMALAKELISRTSLPGQIMADPFMGSGAFIVAALEMKMIPYGCDKSDESYATTLHRIAKWKESKEV